MGAHFLDTLRGLTTLKTFGRSETGREQVARTSGEFGRRTMDVLRVAFLSGLALEFIATVSVALVAVLLAACLLFGDLPFAVALPALLLAPEFYRPLRDLGASRHAGMEGKAAAERIDSILETPIPVQETDDAREPPRDEITVKLKGITFTYPGSEHPALSAAWTSFCRLGLAPHSLVRAGRARAPWSPCYFGSQTRRKAGSSSITFRSKISCQRTGERR